MIQKELIEKVKDFIHSQTGILVIDLQEKNIMDFIEQKSEFYKILTEEYVQNKLLNSEDFTELIQKITINETYFFREEKQFEILEKFIFPEYKNKQISIWSAACSSGEEAISLFVLAKKSGLNVNLFASDINEKILDFFKSSTYTKNSFRKDGEKYLSFLENYYKIDKNSNYKFGDSLIQQINIKKYNLLSDVDFINTKFDIIFIRNVFIYFNKETRKKILKKISSYLNENGKIFFSINEIASVQLEDEYNLKRKNINNVFYFEKKSQINTEKVDKKVLLNNSVLEKDLKYIPKICKKEFFCEKSDEIYSVKSICKNIYSAINLKNYKIAKLESEKIKNDISNKFLYYFLEGFIEFNLGDKKKSESFFKFSYSLKNDFWPGLFYHGILLKELNKNGAKDLFINCKNVLEKSDEKNKYDFVLDSFNSSYFYCLCENYINLDR